MNRFLADFEWNREHEMVLTSEQGISREALEPVELEMLENCSAPGLLPIEWQDWNGMVRFRYRLTGRKMLKHRLAEGMDSITDFYGFLLQHCPFMRGVQRLYASTCESSVGRGVYFCRFRLDRTGAGLCPVSRASGRDADPNPSARSGGQVLGSGITARWQASCYFTSRRR